LAAKANTVKLLIDRWLEQLEVRPSTRAGYEDAAKVSRPFWEIRADKLTPTMIADWLIALKKHRGLRTIQVAGSVLKRTLAHAVELRIIPENPFVSKIPSAPAKRAVPFTDEEVKAIMLTAQRDRLGGAVVLAILCGMRQGEIFGLRWRDIDWNAGQIVIERQAVECRGEVIVGLPKTKAGIRKIFVSRYASEILRRRQETASFEQNDGPDDYVFPQTDGRAMRRSNFARRTWGKLLADLKIPHRGMHHARHTAASIFLRDGVPLPEASAVLGHANPSITLGKYAHALPGHGLAARKVMDDFVNNVLKIDSGSWEGLGDLSNAEIMPLGTSVEAEASEDAAIQATHSRETETLTKKSAYRRPSIRLEPQHSYVYVSREALYLQVWSLSLMKLSQLYGISDNGLRKTCRRHHIPVPKLGEWAKMHAGHPVRRPGLPPLLHGESTMVRIRVSGGTQDENESTLTA